MEKINPIIFEDSRKTFMEILKVSQREVPFANVLGFFFRPREKHGLATLFIEALLNTRCSDIGHADTGVGESIVRNRGYRKGHPEPLVPAAIDKKSVKIEVEQPTSSDLMPDKNKRIDILIEADEFVICIEFKINHDLNNPLKEYKTYVNDKFPGKHHFFIVMTPFKKEANWEAKEYFKQHTEFKQVILSHFFQQIKAELHRFHTSENEQNEYYRYFDDFMQTVENRKIRTVRSQVFSKLQSKLNKSEMRCEYHRKNGGFLEIKGKNNALKIRTTPDGWRLEKWVNKKLEANALTLGTDAGYQQLVDIIIAFHQLSKTSASLVA